MSNVNSINTKVSVGSLISDSTQTNKFKTRLTKINKDQLKSGDRDNNKLLFMPNDDSFDAILLNNPIDITNYSVRDSESLIFMALSNLSVISKGIKVIIDGKQYSLSQKDLLRYRKECVRTDDLTGAKYQLTLREYILKKQQQKIKKVNKHGITYIDGVMVANKTYKIPSSYNPGGLTEETSSAFERMAEDAKKDGVYLNIISGFRSYDMQARIYNNYVAQDGEAAADKYSARPGYSEHQTGLAFDVNLAEDSFANTEEAKWLSKNCYKYGLILRYPKGKESKTGYQYEPWHFRYVGTDLAKKLYNNGNWLALEEYYNISSEYK